MHLYISLLNCVGGLYFATAFVYNLAKVVSQGEFNMPRNHILWSSAHIKVILMKKIFNSEKWSAKTGLAGLVATALQYIQVYIHQYTQVSNVC